MAVASDTTAFTGVVRNSESHHAMAGARIALVCGSDERQAISNDDGSFAIAGITPGSCSVDVTKPNAFLGEWRLPRPLHITLQPNVTTRRDLYIEFHSELEEFRKPQLPQSLEFYPGIIVGPGPLPVH